MFPAANPSPAASAAVDDKLFARRGIPRVPFTRGSAEDALSRDTRLSRRKKLILVRKARFYSRPNLRALFERNEYPRTTYLKLAASRYQSLEERLEKQ